MSEATPLVSVVVRSMARASLARALESIALQDYPRVEVVVVAACGAAHPTLPSQAGPHPVRLVRSALPLSRPLAANAGLDAARGDWVTFLDDDDRYLASHLSGLVAEVARNPHCRVVHSLARAVFADGRTEPFGQPFSLAELYERNFIQLSTTLASCSLVDEGCRFDPALEIHEDWDWFLQLAQRTPFHFAPLASFEWHADQGSSGAAGGANQDERRFAHFRDRVYAKWQAKRKALAGRVESAIRDASARAGAGRVEEAIAICREALAASPNDPHLLGFLARAALAIGKPREALALQRSAVAVRPHDADLRLNLATLLEVAGDRSSARAAVADALRLDPRHEGARARLAKLDRA